MAPLIITLLNILFIIFVYTVFSRRVRALEQRRLPEEMRAEIDELLTTFNRTATTNIGLLEDRISRLPPLTGQAEKQIQALEGLLSRAEALRQEIRQAPVLPKASPLSLPDAPVVTESSFDRKKAVSSYAAAPPKKTSSRPAPVVKAEKRGKKEDAIARLAGKGRSGEEIARELGLSLQQVEMRLAFLRSRDGQK